MLKLHMPFLMFFAGIFAAPLASAQSNVPNNLFTASGFMVKRANTPERLKMLASLPPNKLVVRIVAGKRYFVYADPSACVCAYVGTPEAYQTYQNGGPGAVVVDGGNGSVTDRMMDLDEQEFSPHVAGSQNVINYLFGSDAQENYGTAR